MNANTQSEGTQSKTSFALFVTIPLLLTSCGPTPDDVEKLDDGSPKTVVADSSQNHQLAAFALPDPNVTALALSCVRSDFRSYFRSRRTPAEALREVKPGYVDINWQSLTDRVLAVPVSGSTKRGVRIHYGLTETGAAADAYHRFSIGVSIVKLNRSATDRFWDIEEVPGAFYVVGEDRNLIAPPAGWVDTTTYFNFMHVDRTNEAASTHELVRRHFDTKTYLFEWENRLQKLRDHNNVPPPPPLPATDRVRFVSIAEPYERWTAGAAVEFDMRHHICAVDVNTDAEVIGNAQVAGAQEYFERGADIGTPCPPRCGQRGVFPDHSIPVRTPCP